MGFWWEETADLYDDIKLCITYLRKACGKSELLLENRHAFQRLFTYYANYNLPTDIHFPQPPQCVVSTLA
jgi:hypothetical protein